MKHIMTTLASAAAISALATVAAADVELLHDKGFWSEALDAVGDASEASTGNRLVQTPYATPEQYKAFIQTSAASGDMPDLFTWWTGGIYSELIASGQVASMDPVWDKMIDSGDFDASLRDFYSVDGVAYGIPLHLSRWIALYNTDHFETAGITEPTTWEELEAYFTDPRSNDEVGDFAKGEGAIYLIGDWAVGIVEGAGMTAGEDFSAFIMPNQDPSLPSAAILEGSPIVMSVSGAENPDAMAALEFFASVEGANAWAEASGNAIGNANAGAPNAVVEKINADVAANGTQAIGRWWEAVPAELQGEFVAEFNRFMLDPTMDTAEDVMATLQTLNADYWANQ